MADPIEERTGAGGASRPDDAVGREQRERWLDQALADTFPASDPVASPPEGTVPESPGREPQRRT